MPHAFRLPQRQRGVVLLLLLLALGLGSAVLVMQAYTPARGALLAEQHALEQLAAAREALLGYALVNGRLPRPAVSAVNGEENPLACGTAAQCNGFLPWVTLGIDGADSWGHRLRYSVTPVFTEFPIRAMTAESDKTVRSRDSDGRLFFVVGQAQCRIDAMCAPAVVYSSGKNSPATSALGIEQAVSSDTNVDERQNQQTANNFIARARSNAADKPGGEFDDLVIWVDLQQMYARMHAAHTQ